jgi:hypothetical protein
MQAHEAFVELRGANTVVAFHQACRLQLGAYLEHHIDPEQVVLSSDIGAIAYAAPSVSFIDAVGLTSRDVLEARGRGESVDQVLTALAPSVIADTCHGTCTHAADFSSERWLSNQDYWLTPLPGYTYDTRLRNGEVLQRCGSPDGFSFAATRFELRDRLSPTR